MSYGRVALQSSRRRRARQALWAGVLAVVSAGCGSGGPPATPPDVAGTSPSPRAEPTPTPTPQGSRAVPPVVGTWARKQTCQETAELFIALGLRELGAGYINGLGFRPESGTEIAADDDMCDGAAPPMRRTLFFEANGHWGGTKEGEQVDDGMLGGLDDHQFVVRGEEGAPDLTLTYQVDGTTITFEVETPDGCTSTACIEQVAWAKETFALGPWTRA